MLSWRPLLDGEERDAAIACVRDIARELEAAALEGADLAGGAAGVALFHAYRDRAGLGGGDQVAALLDQAIGAVDATPMTPALHGGFSGIAWVSEHLHGAEDDLNADVDDALVGYLEQTPWQGDYDLISGLVGLGIYALERGARPGAGRGLELVVARLTQLAREEEHGSTFWTPPALLGVEGRAACPDGNYNLGLAHGVPGVVAVLAAAARRGVAGAAPLLERTLGWLLGQRHQGRDSAFDYNIAVPPAVTPPGCRAAWCYGDPGVAVALLGARPDVALELARAAAERPMDGCGVRDFGLCHGSAGLAHIFYRLHRATGDARLREAALRWARDLLARRRTGEPIAGFPSYMPLVPGGDRAFVSDPGFLTGAAGVGLALLGLATDVEPAWDRCLGMSLS